MSRPGINTNNKDDISPISDSRRNDQTQHVNLKVQNYLTQHVTGPLSRYSEMRVQEETKLRNKYNFKKWKRALLEYAAWTSQDLVNFINDSKPKRDTFTVNPDFNKIIHHLISRTVDDEIFKSINCKQLFGKEAYIWICSQYDTLESRDIFFMINDILSQAADSTKPSGERAKLFDQAWDYFLELDEDTKDCVKHLFWMHGQSPKVEEKFKEFNVQLSEKNLLGFADEDGVLNKEVNALDVVHPSTTKKICTDEKDVEEIWNIECFNCHGYGHKARACPSPRGRDKTEIGEGKSKKRRVSAMVQSNSNSSALDAKGIAKQVIELKTATNWCGDKPTDPVVSTVVFANFSLPANALLLNMGTTASVVKDINALHFYQPFDTPRYARTSAGTPMKVLGCGMLILELRSFRIRIANVGYVPQLNYSVISARELIQDDENIVFSGDKVTHSTYGEIGTGLVMYECTMKVIYNTHHLLH